MWNHPAIAFLRELYDQWRKDNALSHGAALAYYTLFSMAPLLMLLIAITGLVLGRAAAQGELVGHIEGVIGPDGARTVEGMIASVSAPKSGLVASAVSLLAMLFGASGVFGQLRTSLNQIWEVSATAGAGMAGVARQRLASFLIILGIGGLLLASLLLTAVLAAVHDLLARHLPLLGEVLPTLNFLLSFLLTTTLFAMIYKVLPDAKMDWRDVWLGATATALLFTIGKTLIGIYLGRAGAASIYGAAGSLVVVLLWVYYCAQIFFVGAEFTEVYSRWYGSRRSGSHPGSLPVATSGNGEGQGGAV
jgi:membrane protein